MIGKTGTDKKEKKGRGHRKRVRYFRKRKGLSQKQLADAVAVSTSVISNLENGKIHGRRVHSPLI